MSLGLLFLRLENLCKFYTLFQNLFLIESTDKTPNKNEAAENKVMLSADRNRFNDVTRIGMKCVLGWLLIAALFTSLVLEIPAFSAHPVYKFSPKDFD
jgi:hypothetical protein